MRTVVGHFNQKMKSKEEGVCFIQTKACMKFLTLQSSQHCPWAHTASPLRVHVVALQHGFIHSWCRGEKTKRLTTCEPDHRLGAPLSAGLCHFKTSRSREGTSCPGVSSLSSPDLKTSKTLRHIYWSTYVLSCRKRSVPNAMTLLRTFWNVKQRRKKQEIRRSIWKGVCLNLQNWSQDWTDIAVNHENIMDTSRSGIWKPLKDDDCRLFTARSAGSRQGTDKRGCIRRSWKGSNAVKDFREVLQYLSFIGRPNTSALFSK